MGTVIDELIVELKLDPKGFDEGQKKAVNNLRRFENESERHSKKIAANADSMTQAFGTLQGKLLAISGLFMGGMGVSGFVDHMMKLTSQTGFFAKSLGLSTKELGAWQAAGATVGATANEIAQALGGYQKALANAQLGQPSFINAMAYTTSQAGQGPQLTPYKADGSWKSPTEYLLSASEWYEKRPDKAVSTVLMERNGMPQGMINLLSLGPTELQKRLKEGEKFAPSADDVKKFQDLQVEMGKASMAAEKLGRSIALLLTPGLIKFMESVNRIVEAFVKGGWIEGLKAANDEASAGTGEGFKSLGVDASAVGEKVNQGWWGRFKSKFQWHNPFAQRPDPITNSGDGPGGTSVPSSPSANPEASARSSTAAARGAAAPGSSEFLRNRRQRYADEINNTPGLRDRVGGMLALEGTAQPTMESLLNRIDYVNTERAKRGLPLKTIDDMLTPAFYGPIRRGELPRGIAQYKRNPSRFDRAIDRALGGSHVIGGYTDQGMPTDPNGSITNMQRRGVVFPFMKIGGNEFTDWEGGSRLGAGGRRESTAYRTMIEEGLAREATATAAGPPSTLTGQPMASAANRTFDNWNRLAIGARGALMRGNVSTTTNNNRTATFGDINVVTPPGADAAGYASSIKQELERYSPVMNANQGLL